MDLWTLCKLFRLTVSLLKTLKPEKAGMRTFFCYLVATPVPASQHKQTNKQFCLFNVQRVKGSFSAHNFQETMCILQACTSNCPMSMCTTGPPPYHQNKIPTLQKNEDGLHDIDSQAIQSSKHSFSGILPYALVCPTLVS